MTVTNFKGKGEIQHCYMLKRYEVEYTYKYVYISTCIYIHIYINTPITKGQI